MKQNGNHGNLSELGTVSEGFSVFFCGENSSMDWVKLENFQSLSTVSKFPKSVETNTISK